MNVSGSDFEVVAGVRIEISSDALAVVERAWKRILDVLEGEPELVS
jgi:hypothetical protein